MDEDLALALVRGQCGIDDAQGGVEDRCDGCGRDRVGEGETVVGDAVDLWGRGRSDAEDGLDGVGGEEGFGGRGGTRAEVEPWEDESRGVGGCGDGCGRFFLSLDHRSG